MSYTKKLCALVLLGFAAAAPDQSKTSDFKEIAAKKDEVDFTLTLDYSGVSEEEKHLLKSYLDAAAGGLNKVDATKLTYITYSIANELGQILTSYVKLNRTVEYKQFAALTSADQKFATNVETALRQFHWGSEDVFESFRVELDKVLTPEQRVSFAKVLELPETLMLKENLKATLSKKSNDERVLLVGATKNILLNTIVYVPTTTRAPATSTTQAHRSHHDSSTTKAPGALHYHSGSGVIHACLSLVAVTLSTQLLFK